MVTKIKPRRVKTDTTWTSWDSLAYQDEASFQWWWGWAGDMRYADFDFTTESWGSVVLGLRTEITPTENFTVAPPTTVKDGQTYILRVTNGATAYTMALTWGITNPYSVPLTLTENNTDQFEFLAVWSTLELQANNAEVTNVVRLTWNQTVNWTKTFTTSPVVPSKTTDATNTWTAIATEAQVYKKADTIDLNTKTFYLSSTSDLVNAQAALDWYLAGKEPIIVYGQAWYGGYWYYYLNKVYSSSIVFRCDTSTVYSNYNNNSTLWYTNLDIQYSNWVVTRIVSNSYNADFLSTNHANDTSWVPTQDYHPATKKYVDDNDTYIGSSAPSNPTEGRLRYDTTNDVLKSYDGSSWKNVNTQVTVEDNLTSTSTTNALSANQWRELKWMIDDLMALWRFLSLWDATTGLPISFPLTTPYTYLTWDYYLVETVSSATPPVNYRPIWSSFDGTTASTTQETDELEVWDVYIYDGTNWLLQSNHWKTVTFANIAGQPTDNTNLASALWAKADDNAVVKLTWDQTIAWTKTFSTSPVVPNKTADATNTWTAIATEAQVYKKADATDLNTKTFYLSSTSDLTTAQAAYDWFKDWKNAIISLSNVYYISFSNNPSALTATVFFREMNLEMADTNNSYTSIKFNFVSFAVSNGTVTSITKDTVSWDFLKGNINYSNPYTPQYDWSPATKKYVDDNKWIQNDTTWTTTTVTKIWAWTSAEYALITPAADTIYYVF